MSRYEKKLFKIDEMEYIKYSKDHAPENIYIIQCPKETSVDISGVNITSNIVNRIEISKHEGENRADMKYPDWIYARLYMGNIEIAYDIFESDIVVVTRKRENVHGKERVTGFEVRKAENYDY